MKHFVVTGMSCAACSARVENAVKSIKGVTGVSVNLLTGDLVVDGNIPDELIKKSVIKAGYGIAETLSENTKQEYFNIKKRLIASIAILLILMYFSMFYVMFNTPVFKVLDDNPIIMGIIQAVLALSILIINGKFFVSGAKGVINKAPNMDTLVAMGSGISFIYSLILLIINGNHVNLHQLYFDSSAMILTLITVGKMLESRAKGKTMDALNDLKEMAPKTALKLISDKEEAVDVSTLKIGDIIIVKPGESIPCDGVVISGNSFVDESAITGESIPLEKYKDSVVIGATQNKNGVLKCRVTAEEKDGVFSKIIQTVADANGTKAPISRLADKIAGIFVPTVILIALITFIAWIISGKTLAFAVTKGVSVLVISCPCSLGLATPVAVMAATGVGAKHGILFKNAEALEVSGKIKTIAFDKTGTITTGKPTVTDVFAEDSMTALNYAFSLEKSSSHPLASAITEYALNNNSSCYDVDSFNEMPGKGVCGIIKGDICYCVNYRASGEFVKINKDMLNIIDNSTKNGKTPVIVIKGDTLLGVICLADTIKSDSIDAIKKLKKMGKEVVMITGDNRNTAGNIAAQCGIDSLQAEVLPNEKADAVKRLMNDNKKIAMVGDGINDAPALTVADVGIAMGGGKDIATKSADVVLMKNDLYGVVNTLLLSKKALLTIKENLFWAFIYNVIGIPLAAGVLYYPFKISLTPMLGAAAMSLSSLCVVLNALRIYLFKPEVKEYTVMTKTIYIEGMMCSHCEAHVKNSLLKLKEVSDVTVSHEKGTAELILNDNIENDILINAVQSEGYKVTEIK